MQNTINIENSVINVYVGVVARQEHYNRVFEKIQENKENYDKISVLTEQKLKTKECTDILSNYYNNKEQYIKATRIKECGNYLQLKHYIDLDYSSVSKMNLCRERLCLNCAYVSARENARYLIKATEGLQQRFLTFTVQNVQGERLRVTLDNMRKAVKRMFRALKIKDYYEKYEITYNDKTKTFHPHIHILTPIHNYTFKKGASNKLWSKYYNEVSGADFSYLSTENKAVDDNIKSCFEMSKYITKPTSITKDTIHIFDTQLKGVHLVQAHGIYRTLLKSAKEYFAQNKEELDTLLLDYDFELIDYIFNGQNYIELNSNEGETL